MPKMHVGKVVGSSSEAAPMGVTGGEGRGGKWTNGLNGAVSSLPPWRAVFSGPVGV